MGLAGAGVTDEAERQALLDPFALGEGVDQGSVDVRVRVEVELAERLVAGKPGGLDPPLGAASGPVVALGQEEFGEEAEVGLPNDDVKSLP
ncbi:hypothetical protein SAV14893_093950 [Streptomyces avermitilis]|uniref:Uncharacterized protein n=1 Tax=Streptomyces avermitilis TaxID=33903 RepID=A0A4D4MDG7_STRAX|nr:hypothetical protein SAVMC3_02480 [Streptomyces avermitilis]GDY70002.1 hypothetical protein SAV14893_093950 [Streptomyces avermitilis]GDY80271.1 hypothetical protein SAV31267_097560 [Streptomyces avermitilis]